MEAMNGSVENKVVFFLWSVAAIATAGSLFFSEVMGFQPCTLCWYQRIAMYPLVILFAVGLFQPIKATIHFTIPLVIIGQIFSVYHNLLHYKIIPESAAPCVLGVPCSTVYINWFGFLTIPMLSLISFTIILAGLIYLNRRVTSEK